MVQIVHLDRSLDGHSPAHPYYVKTTALGSHHTVFHKFNPCRRHHHIQWSHMLDHVLEIVRLQHRCRQQDGKFGHVPLHQYPLQAFLLDGERGVGDQIDVRRRSLVLEEVRGLCQYIVTQFLQTIGGMPWPNKWFVHDRVVGHLHALPLQQVP